MAQSEMIEEIKSEISWFGHASFMLEDDKTGQNVYYLDPFELSSKVLRKADVVLITHAHYDHCSKEDLAKIRNSTTKIFAPKGCSEALGEYVELTEPNKSYGHQGLKFRTIPAYNIKTERLKAHPRENNWVGYVININGKTIYHAGDTDFTPEMRTLKTIDVAMLPIGGRFTMDVNEAVEAANAINAKVTVPMHYKRLLGEKAEEAEKLLKKGVKGDVYIFEETD